MTRPTPDDLPPVELIDDEFYLDEPVNGVHPRVIARFRKMLEYVMPQHIEQCYDPADVTPESVRASIESLLENLPFEQLSELIWGTIEDHLEQLDQEMHEA